MDGGRDTELSAVVDAMHRIHTCGWKIWFWDKLFRLFLFIPFLFRIFAGGKGAAGAALLDCERFCVTNTKQR